MINWTIFQRVLEALYCLSGVAVAILAGFGLKQLRLAKSGIAQNAELARMSAKRDSYKLAAEQCQLYMTKIMPLVNELNEKLQEKNLAELLSTFKVVVSKTGISVTPPKGLRTSPLNPKFLTIEVIQALSRTANALEGFAVLFTSGVAAETVAFSSVGQTYCDSIQQYAPLIVPISSNTHYKNLLKLFQIWQLRIDEKQLRRERDEIIDRLAETQTICIDPLGT